MAKTYINKNNKLIKKYKIRKYAMLFLLAVWSSFFILLYLFPEILRTNYYLFLGIMIVSYISFAYIFDRIGILSVGIDGEARTLDILKGLSSEYTIFPNVNITSQGKTNEFDFIVIGPNGVFVIETKSYSGALSGHVMDNELTQTKETGKNVYNNKIRNPFKQTSTQISRLAALFDENDIKAFINGVVHFSNDTTTVSNIKGLNETKIMMCFNHNLNSVIVNSKSVLNEKTKQRIIQSILKNVKQYTTK